LRSGEPEIWMWAQACEILERAERLHRRFFELGRSRTRRPVWEPPVDIFESDSKLWVLIALPGVDPETIEIVVDSGVLIVAGDRSFPIELRAAAVHRLEIPHGRFERRLELPVGRFELAARLAANGCLLLGLSKLG
jgi:HSP20 family protein